MDSVVAHLKIPWSDVVIICFEKYWSSFGKRNYPEAMIVLNEMDKNSGRDGGFSGVKNEWRRKKYADQIIKGNNFYLYSPVDSRNIHRHLIFSRHCQGYYIIEEGLASYFDFSHMKFQKKNMGLKRFFLPKASQYISQYPVNRYDSLKGAFGFYENVYPYLEEKEIIPIKINQKDDNDVDYSKPVFICDGMVDHGQCSIPFLVKFLRNFFNTGQLDDFYIKFHIRQSKEEVDAILEMLNDLGVKFEVMEGTVIVEYLSYHGNINLYGFYSSLLLYNKILGKGGSYALGQEFLNSLPEEVRAIRSRTIFGDRVRNLFDKVGVKQIAIRSEETNK